MGGIIFGIIIGVAIIVAILQSGLSSIGDLFNGAFSGITGCLSKGVGCIALIVMFAVLAIAAVMCT